MFPHFLGIGAQKGATSWLHLMLKSHPEVWLPPTKELHFFDDSATEYSHFRRAFSKLNGHRISYKRFMLTDLRNVKWAYKFLFKKRTIQYYSDLFTPANGQICGEISPNYARLPIHKIQRVQKHIPKVKLIYILRDPIDRDWSATCMYFKNNEQLAIKEVSTDRLLEVAITENKSSHSNYAKNIAAWNSIFPQEQLFIGFYEEIQQNPYYFLKRLCAFLEVDFSPLETRTKDMRQKVNSHSEAIPPELLLAIATQEYENIRMMHQRFTNSFTKAWLKRAESILQK